MHDWPDDKLLTAKEVAAYLGVKGTGFREARRAGEIPEPIYIGTSPRWRWGDLKEWTRALTIVLQKTPAVFRRKATENDSFQPSATDSNLPPSEKKKGH
jgi:predicted DNA-binding transcriptional regulator AlpA